MKAAVLAIGACVLATQAMGSEVSITKSHVCCQGCVKAIEATLEKVEGVSEVAVDQDEKTINFEVADAKVARRAVRALGRAGFGGEAKHEGKIVALPTPKPEEDTKSDEVKLDHVHLCCGACVKAVEGAVSSVEGVESVTCDRDKGTCTATGKDVSALSVIQALRDAGFNGSLPQAKGEGKAKKKSAT